MSEKEFEKKLESRKFELLDTADQLEKIIDLIKHSHTLDFETQAKTTAFLEGYTIALKEQIEWFRYGVEEE